MLDNFTPQGIREAAKALKGDWASATGGQESAFAKRALVEVSGGLTEENMEEHLCDGSSFLSFSSFRCPFLLCPAFPSFASLSLFPPLVPADHTLSCAD
jgi:hypothetical protein